MLARVPLCVSASKILIRLVVVGHVEVDFQVAILLHLPLRLTTLEDLLDLLRGVTGPIDHDTRRLMHPVTAFRGGYVTPLLLLLLLQC